MAMRACVCVSVCVPDLALLLGPLQDPLLNGALADEAVDGDLLGLTQPVGPVHGLLVHRGVPVAVVEDDLEGKAQRGQRAAADGDGPRRFLTATHRVGGCQVDAQSSRPGAQQEDKDVRPAEEGRWRTVHTSETHPCEEPR